MYYLGIEGYHLYAELHQNYYNKLIHGCFMPGVVYGTLCGLPALLNLRSIDAHKFQLLLYVIYALYYMSFDLVGMLLTGLYYSPWLFLSLRQKYKIHNRWPLVYQGLIIVIYALLIQELIGHTLFEKVNSDPTQVLNSILIAPLFGSNSIFHREI